MTASRSAENPFDLLKASDFSDQQIIQYWVDLVGEGQLKDLLKPTLQMPMLLLGGKGSGKTHLMRYFSSSVQRLRHSGDLMAAARDDGHLGIYVRADGLNSGRFGGKGQDDDSWIAVFSYYFELWLATNFLKCIQECLTAAPDALADERGFIEDARKLFTNELPSEIYDLASYVEFLTETRRHIDHVVANCAIKRSLSEIEIRVAHGQLVFGLPELLVKHSDNFSSILFVYMIDEIENFSALQQKFLNSLIRYRRGPVSIKVGSRLYGIRTKETLGGSGEEIRKDAEYEMVILDSWLRENKAAYRGLAFKIIAKRLKNAGLVLGVNGEAQELRQYFEELDPSNHFQMVTLALVEAYDLEGKRRPYFSSLEKIITGFKPYSADTDLNAYADKIIDDLAVKNFPLLEKLNLYILYRDWGAFSNLGEVAEKIKLQCSEYLVHGKDAAPEYAYSLSQFGSDLLAQLYQDCDRRRVAYAGIETIITLSQGIPRNLLTLLKCIYRRSHFREEKPFQVGSPISIKSQVDGIRDAAAWFLEDAQPDKFGPDVRVAVESLGRLFRGVRFSLKPAECDLGTFTVGNGAGSAKAREILEHAENWSYLIKINDGAVNRNDGATIDEKYQLSPMLAARWEVSENRRGTIELQSDLFNAIFDPKYRSKVDALIRERLRGMREPYVGFDPDDNQAELF